MLLVPGLISLDVESLAIIYFNPILAMSPSTLTVYFCMASSVVIPLTPFHDSHLALPEGSKVKLNYYYLFGKKYYRLFIITFEIE